MRRLLGMSWTEWQELPWYEQRALRESLARDPKFHELLQALIPRPPATPEEEAASLAAMGLSVT